MDPKSTQNINIQHTRIIKMGCFTQYLFTFHTYSCLLFALTKNFVFPKFFGSYQYQKAKNRNIEQKRNTLTNCI